MHKRKSNSVSRYFRAVLYLLFLFYFFGCLFGITVSFHNESVPLYNELNQKSTLYVILRNLSYHIAAIIACLIPFGAVFIPLIVFSKGFFLTVAVVALQIGGSESAKEIFFKCGLPALFQLPSLFYLSALGFCFRFQSKFIDTVYSDLYYKQHLKFELLGVILLLLIGVLMKSTV